MSFHRRRSTGQDPHWTALRYPGTCNACKKVLPRGARAFYYPNTRTILGDDCCGAGSEAARDFCAHAFDDAQGLSQFTSTGQVEFGA